MTKREKGLKLKIQGLEQTISGMHITLATERFRNAQLQGELKKVKEAQDSQFLRERTQVLSALGQMLSQLTEPIKWLVTKEQL